MVLSSGIIKLKSVFDIGEIEISNFDGENLSTINTGEG